MKQTSRSRPEGLSHWHGEQPCLPDLEQGHSLPTLATLCGFHGNRTLSPHCHLDLRSVPSNIALLCCDAVQNIAFQLHLNAALLQSSPETSSPVWFLCCVFSLTVVG